MLPVLNELTQDVVPIPSCTTTRASIADTIMAGHIIRYQQKSKPRKPVKPQPKPARPRGPKPPDVQLSQRAARAHLRCLRRQGVITGRMDQLAKPTRRRVLDQWREYAHLLPCESIARFRAFLDADEPPKPDQAYQYFVNLRKIKKKEKKGAFNMKQVKLSTFDCIDRKKMAARSASVAFAVGILARLARPEEYILTDGMLRLSNIIFRNISKFMKSNGCNCRKSKFLKEMSDKIAVWIEEILIDSEDRMLMMDFDEDEDVLDVEDDASQPDTASVIPTESVTAQTESSRPQNSRGWKHKK